jgi:hypothetical protein
MNLETTKNPESNEAALGLLNQFHWSRFQQA